MEQDLGDVKSDVAVLKNDMASVKADVREIRQILLTLVGQSRQNEGVSYQMISETRRK